ncbi:MAG: glycoside hydrolase family 88 protein [Lewinellaceae bacterium]|nr:glycoside hydrolase family 88 protein [Saprospiraceae bacterium]MCB9315377.1 glycoside hydrolase family 88 protein [Lewinellaceae bacterium]MCB9333211.1 glycoside hydrolase family 88 protein [Lewinellaceae bacterium]
MNINAGILFVLLAFVISGGFSCPVGTPSGGQAIAPTRKVTVAVPTDHPWSERMVLSVIKRSPEAWMNDFSREPRWSYTHGLMMNAIVKTAAQTGKSIYFDYAKSYADTMISADGTIRDYELADFNIDNIAPGAHLFAIYEKTGDPKYKKAIATLKHQIDWQPQTTDGGYWHKLRYPWQMWLDGLFMGEPFCAEYAMRNNKPEMFDHIALQFTLAEKHTRDEKTGLLYHAWDESRVQRWANPETGCSPHFWGRAVGWYCMALVDVLDFFPEDHPQRTELIAILNRTLEAVLKVQDPKTKTWWQVLDQPNRKGNYLEATASCMFTYAMIKGVNEGYLPEKFRQLAQQSYAGILKQFIEVGDGGEVNLNQCCSVAGLGGDPYRDGSYEYYINEPIRANDAKGLGPFILASLEFEKNPR